MLFVHWLIATLAILVASYLVPGVETTLLGAVVLAVVLGIINLFVRPVLRLLTLPLTVITLGLFSLVLNALLVLLADWLVEGFATSGFWAAFLFALILSLINAVFNRMK